jgi:hypothetical protein
MVVKSINCLISDGTTVKIDLKFYKEFKKYNWCCNDKGYIVTWYTSEYKKQKILYLHHYVLNFKYDPNIDLVADHKFGNKRDYRLKKLRLVSRRINALNQRRNSNTGFPNIGYYCYNNNPYYRVSFINIYNISDSKLFPFIEGINEVDAFQKAFEFFEDIKKTLPHYIEAFPNPDEDSSSDESIEELNYDDKINLDLLNINNTSKLNNICDYDSCWRVNYYNKKGNPTTKTFKYFPKSDDSKDEALTKALLFQNKYEKSHPKKREKKLVINNINNNITSKYDIMTEGNKQIPKKSLFELLLEEEENHHIDDFMIVENINHNKKSLFGLMMNAPPKKSLFELLLECNYQNPLEIGHEESMIIDYSSEIDINDTNIVCYNF